MKRLIADEQQEQYYDPTLGSNIEIINTRSKYNGFRGKVDNEYHKDKYKVILPAAEWENTKRNHLLYVDVNQAYKWLRIMPDDNQEGQ